MIKEALFKDLLVQARAIEAGSDAELDIFNESGVARRSHDTIGIISLIEHQALEDGLIVDLDRLAINRNAAHAGVALRLVNRVAGGVDQLDVKVV